MIAIPSDSGLELGRAPMSSFQPMVSMASFTRLLLYRSTRELWEGRRSMFSVPVSFS